MKGIWLCATQGAEEERGATEESTQAVGPREEEELSEYDDGVPFCVSLNVGCVPRPGLGLRGKC